MRVIDVEEEINRAKMESSREMEERIARMLPPDLREQFLAQSCYRKTASTTSGHSECDDRASAAGSTSTNDDFMQVTPGESKSF
ncbi:unnamed protein product [Gongylonema pulchrum]|uniref:Uncharacterized protein n=1 Tax=Gongylonema pulchrum TaxID=637853 RepID=A0A3P6SVY5_9BILA|nr:unnamed protein product [Gongylonema pulchrum]